MPAPPKASLLTLPRELRDLIYTYIIPPTRLSLQSRIHAGIYTFPRTWIALAHTNRQLRTETITAYRSIYVECVVLRRQTKQRRRFEAEEEAESAARVQREAELARRDEEERRQLEEARAAESLVEGGERRGKGVLGKAREDVRRDEVMERDEEVVKRGERGWIREMVRRVLLGLALRLIAALA